MKFIKISLALAICITATVGDFVVFKSKYSDSQLFRALADNSVHAAIGFLSALLFFSHGINISAEAYVYNIIFCTVVSSLIDIDHFIVAKSIHFKDLIRLQRRGFLHCSTLWIAYTTLLLVYSCMTKKLNLYILSFMLIIAFTSHHIRDGNRRGLWLYPFGQTQPLNKFVYKCSIALLPILLFYVYNYLKPTVKYSIVHSEVV